MHGRGLLLNTSSCEIGGGGGTIQNKYPGILDFTEVHSTGMVNVINSSMVLENANVIKTGESSYNLDLGAFKEKKSFATTSYGEGEQEI